MNAHKQRMTVQRRKILAWIGANGPLMAKRWADERDIHLVTAEDTLRRMHEAKLLRLSDWKRVGGKIVPAFSMYDGRPDAAPPSNLEDYLLPEEVKPVEVSPFQQYAYQIFVVGKISRAA